MREGLSGQGYLIQYFGIMMATYPTFLKNFCLFRTYVLILALYLIKTVEALQEAVDKELMSFFQISSVNYLTTKVYSKHK